MRKNRKAAGTIAVVLIGVMVVFIFAAAFVPTGNAPEPDRDFVPFRDDARAASLAPAFSDPDGHGLPEAVYYRAARASGREFWAFHPVWEFERNDSPGIMPFLSRTLYTGGLSLQRLMFGKGDVELVVIETDAGGKPLRVAYETAKDYDPSAFSVRHEKVDTVPPSGPWHFAVISWNHMLEIREGSSGASPSPVPAYFTEELWNAFGMTKDPPTTLRKHRAHVAWELSLVP